MLPCSDSGRHCSWQILCCCCCCWYSEKLSTVDDVCMVTWSANGANVNVQKWLKCVCVCVRAHVHFFLAPFVVFNSFVSCIVATSMLCPSLLRSVPAAGDLLASVRPPKFDVPYFLTLEFPSLKLLPLSLCQVFTSWTFMTLFLFVDCALQSYDFSADILTKSLRITNLYKGIRVCLHLTVINSGRHIGMKLLNKSATSKPNLFFSFVLFATKPSVFVSPLPTSHRELCSDFYFEMKLCPHCTVSLFC